MDEVYFLRHYISTLKYRSSKAILNTPINYYNFDLGSGVRTPIEILKHMSDVIRYAQTVFDDRIQMVEEISTWDDEVNIFFKELSKLDELIETTGIPQRERIIEQLIQGPLSDAMTHVGQLSMIRRMAGEPIPRENFIKAEIRVE
ncbi:hypothetical protein [Cohnella lupini]|uniref:DinB family protein n=1 Tax=Cohnella lupini TaxID=1294267 RepID=A0A3D9IWC8_9BACL|nr:hypothetical protein [Cohnella lupini]RED66143.1 hypothetical protein DFP95_101641 [Cohnella lupini]